MTYPGLDEDLRLIRAFPQWNAGSMFAHVTPDPGIGDIGRMSARLRAS